MTILGGAVLDIPEPRRILHVGCGGAPLPEWLQGEQVRLDIDEKHKPDLVADMSDLGEIGFFSAIYCDHSLEHLPRHKVRRAIREFCRVLLPKGLALIFVPDLEDARPTDDVLYISPAGPITGIDLFYGHSKLLEINPYMQHRTGFTSKILEAEMWSAGFSKVKTQRLGSFNLFGCGVK